MENSILNVSVSGLRDYNTPTNPKPVNLLQWLRSKKYAKQVDDIRKEADKQKRDVLKATLPAITPHGTFSYRASKCLISHSGFMQFDIDFKENSHIANYNDLKSEICKIVNVAYCGLSVSGTGLWGLIPIAYPDKHSQHFDFIKEAFKGVGITIDDKPRNVASLRGYSYDSEAYFNHNAKKLEQYSQPKEKARKATIYNNSGHSIQSEVETLINQITTKGIDITPNYSEWLNVGFALASEFGEAGRGYFHDISCQYANYDHSEADSQYNKCLRSNGKGITIKTFFHICKQSGVELPKTTYMQKEKSHTPQLLHNISSNVLFPNGSQTKTGREFNNIIIAGFHTKEGRSFDILFTKEGEFIKPGEQSEAVARLSNFFEKKLTPALFDHHPCLIHKHT